MLEEYPASFMNGKQQDGVLLIRIFVHETNHYSSVACGKHNTMGTAWCIQGAASRPTGPDYRG